MVVVGGKVAGGGRRRLGVVTNSFGVCLVASGLPSLVCGLSNAIGCCPRIPSLVLVCSPRLLINLARTAAVRASGMFKSVALVVYVPEHVTPENQLLHATTCSSGGGGSNSSNISTTTTPATSTPSTQPPSSLMQAHKPW